MAPATTRLIYIVRGDAGDREDHERWDVRAYGTQDAALREAVRMNEAIAKFRRWCDENDEKVVEDDYLDRFQRKRQACAREAFDELDNIHYDTVYTAVALPFYGEVAP